MERLEIRVRTKMSRSDVQRVLDTWAGQRGSEARPMGRLARQYRTLGENMHWHISGSKRGMGTVEVSYVPSTGILTALVHDNRRGLWAGTAYKDLARHVRKTIGKPES